MSAISPPKFKEQMAKKGLWTSQPGIYESSRREKAEKPKPQKEEEDEEDEEEEEEEEEESIIEEEDLQYLNDTRPPKGHFVIQMKNFYSKEQVSFVSFRVGEKEERGREVKWKRRVWETSNCESVRFVPFFEEMENMWGKDGVLMIQHSSSSKAFSLDPVRRRTTRERVTAIQNERVKEFCIPLLPFTDCLEPLLFTVDSRDYNFQFKIFSSIEDWEKTALKNRENHVILYLDSSSNVPKLDFFNESDPYVLSSLGEPPVIVGGGMSSKMKRLVLREKKRTLNIVERWPTRIDNPNPEWRSARDLGVKTGDDERVHVEVWDEDESSPDDLVGSVDVTLKEIKKFPNLSRFEIVSYKKEKKRLTCDVKIALIPPLLYAPRKTIFFIRHGQSVWNKAQADKDVRGMMDQVDHPLDEIGCQQALELQKKIAAGGPDSDEFMSAQAIIASPLTRAFQTCMIAAHPLAKTGKTVFLVPSCREKRNLGGRDSAGDTIGQDIITKAYTTATTYLGEEQSKALFMDDIKYDLSEVSEKWWTDVEVIGVFRRRLYDFVQRIRFSNFDKILVVSHSHFFRALLCNHMHPFHPTSHIAHEMKKKVIANCAVAKVEFDFLNHPTEFINDVTMMFGTGLA